MKQEILEVQGSETPTPTSNPAVKMESDRVTAEAIPPKRGPNWLVIIGGLTLTAAGVGGYIVLDELGISLPVEESEGEQLSNEEISAILDQMYADGDLDQTEIDKLIKYSAGENLEMLQSSYEIGMLSDEGVRESVMELRAAGLEITDEQVAEVVGVSMEAPLEASAPAAEVATETATQTPEASPTPSAEVEEEVEIVVAPEMGETTPVTAELFADKIDIFAQYPGVAGTGFASQADRVRAQSELIHQVDELVEAGDQDSLEQIFSERWQSFIRLAEQYNYTIEGYDKAAQAAVVTSPEYEETLYFFPGCAVRQENYPSPEVASLQEGMTMLLEEVAPQAIDIEEGEVVEFHVQGARGENRLGMVTSTEMTVQSEDDEPIVLPVPQEDSIRVLIFQSITREANGELMFDFFDPDKFGPHVANWYTAALLDGWKIDGEPILEGRTISYVVTGQTISYEDRETQGIEMGPLKWWWEQEPTAFASNIDIEEDAMLVVAAMDVDEERYYPEAAPSGTLVDGVGYTISGRRATRSTLLHGSGVFNKQAVGIYVFSNGELVYPFSTKK